MQALDEQHLEQLARLCAQHGVARLDVFGSAAQSGFDPQSSDLDFLVEFLPGAATDAFDRYFSLLEGLTAICQRRVDLVPVKALRNPYFMHAVEDSRRQVYVAQAA